MKILEVNLERGWRGGERQTLWTSQALQALGVEVSILARHGQPLAAAAQAAGLPVVELEGSGAAWRWLWRHGRQFDVIHAQSAHALTYCVASACGHRRPVVATRRVAFPLRGAMTRFKYARSALLVAISNAAAAPLEQAGLGPVHRIPSAVRREPVDAAQVAALRQRWIPTGKKVLGTVAALTHEKDPLTLVQAVGELAAQRSDFVFLHVGDGPMRAELEQVIQAAGLTSVYLLAGFQDPIAPWYELLDGYVMSSRSEGLGSSVLDAMLRDIPVASTAAGGLAEALGEGRGVLVPVGDYRALGTAMASLVDSSADVVEARQQQIELARAWVEAECGLETMAHRYLELFQSLLNQGPCR